jgi:dTDP-4-amino-4,6-dideoxygalactose transaminase
MPEVGWREWMAAGRAIARKDLLRYADNGHETDRFEARLADYVGVKHALCVTSGTMALVTALTCAGIGPGDEVIVPAYTWMASASSVVSAGAVPVLADIDDTLTLDPSDFERRITPHTRAVMPVHMLNAPADMDAILAIAKKHKLIVIEDAAQAAGARYKGRPVGSFGDAAAFSFNRYKNINIGEGGALLTNNTEMFGRALHYHDLGAFIRNYEHGANTPPFVGLNLRITEVQGAMLNAQMDRFPGYLKALNARRSAVAALFRNLQGVRVSPHHDDSGALTLTVQFDREEDAIAFSERTGAMRLYDSSKHVYTNWEAILERRAAHPKLDPWKWAARDITYDETTCARSLDILKRTCKIWFDEKRMLPLVKLAAQRRFAPALAGFAPANAQQQGQAIGTEAAGLAS